MATNNKSKPQTPQSIERHERRLAYRRAYYRQNRERIRARESARYARIKENDPERYAKLREAQREAIERMGRAKVSFSRNPDRERILQAIQEEMAAKQGMEGGS